MNQRVLSILILLFFLQRGGLAQNSLAQVFTRADTLRGMLSELRTCYDVNYYHLDVKIDIPNRSIKGSNLFQFTAARDFKRLQFDLFNNFKIEKIAYNGTILKYSREFNAVFVEFPEVIKKGTLSQFTVYYSGTPLIAAKPPWEGGFIFKEDINKAPWVAVACQQLGASSWWPNKDHQSDEVDSMLISVTVPRGLQNIGNGRLISTEVQPDGSTKYNWRVSYPINNYNVTLNVGDFAHLTDMYLGEKGQLTLDYYVLKQNEEKAKVHFKDVKEMLRCFEYWFGPYPFYDDGYKLIEAPYLGMEHQSAIAYGNRYKKGYAGTDLSGTGLGLTWDYIIVHESGHEWFGNNITSKDIADMWVHEAFTTYSESLFVESKYGKEFALKYIIGERKNIKNDKPIIGSYNVNAEGSGDMYFKGTSLLNTIRTLIDNDTLWRTILRGLNTRFGLKTTTGNEIIKYINFESKKDFTKIFQQYLEYKDIPTLKIERLTANTLAYYWDADVKDFDMPVRVKLPGHAIWQFIYPTTKSKTLKIKGRASSLKVDTDNFYIHVKFP